MIDDFGDAGGMLMTVMTMGGRMVLVAGGADARILL